MDVKIKDLNEIALALQVLKAWHEEGINPQYHALIKRRIRIMWPTLSDTLDLWEVLFVGGKALWRLNRHRMCS